MSETRKPRKIDANTWFYIEPKGLCIVHECREGGDGGYLQTDMFTLSWRSIEAALKARASLTGTK